jgi:hypothetical protein
MIGCLWDLIVVGSAIAWLAALYMQGVMSASFAAFALVIITILLAIGRRLGGNVGRLTRFCFRVGVPCASLLTFVITLTGGSMKDILPVLGGFAVLLIALSGLYLMIFGAFTSGKKK